MIDIGSNQTLKSFASKSVKYTGGMKMHIQNAVQNKMYKRSMFNINCSLSGINSQFSSCYAPNIIEVSITINADGIKGGVHDVFQKDEFLTPISTYFSSGLIHHILLPKKTLLINSVYSNDEDGKNIIVNDNGAIDNYQRTSFNHSKTYRVYFPHVSRGGTGDNAGGTSGFENVFNQKKLYSLSLSCQDKLYTLKATALSDASTFNIYDQTTLRSRSFI